MLSSLGHARLLLFLAPLALDGCGQAFIDGRAVGTGAGPASGNDLVGTSTTGGGTPTDSNNGGSGNPNTSSDPNGTVSSNGCVTFGTPVKIGAAGSAVPFSMAVANSLPSIAWGSTRVYYSTWTGAAWAGLSQSDTAGIAASSGPPGLALDNGSPYLAFVSQDGTNGTLYLYNYVGGQWVSHTPQPYGDANGTVSQVNLSLGNGLASITWHHGATTSLQRLGLGAASSFGTRIDDAANATWVRPLSYANSNEVVVWSEPQKASVGRYSGSTGVTAFGTSETLSPAGASVGEPVAAALQANGNPIIAWQDTHTGTAAIYLLSWNGTSWAGLGSSANDGGITPKSESHRPALALDANGRPWVTYEDTKTQQVYVQYWTGTAWAAVSLTQGDSASGTGISGAFTQGMSAVWPQVGFTTQGKAVLGWCEAGAQVRVCALQ